MKDINLYAKNVHELIKILTKIRNKDSELYGWNGFDDEGIHLHTINTYYHIYPYKKDNCLTNKTL